MLSARRTPEGAASRPRAEDVNVLRSRERLGLPITRTRDMDNERPPSLRTVGPAGEEKTAPAGGLRPDATFAVNETAELVVDLLSATGLVPLDKLALVRGRTGTGSLAQAIVEEGIAPPEGVARTLALRHQVPYVDLALCRDREGRRHADPAARAGARRRDPVRARRRRPPRRARRSRQPARARRAPSRHAPSARARRRLARRHPRSSSSGWPAPPRRSALAQCSRRPTRAWPIRRRTRPTISRPTTASPMRRSSGSSTRHLPGGRGRRQRRPLRAAGGRARRPLPRRRRAPRGAADPEAAGAGRHHPPEGAREARHRRAAQAAGRPHLAERRRRRPHARHPRRDAADGRGREGRRCASSTSRGSAPTLEELGLSDAMRDQLRRHHREADRRAARHRADRLGQVDDALRGASPRSTGPRSTSSPSRIRSSTGSPASTRCRSTSAPA